MAAKQTQSVKRPVPHQGRNVMLTRFKLSQLKRQLREKERRTSESKGSAIQKSEDKKLKRKGTPSRDKRDCEDLHQSKLKRKIASTKIVLKARHELKLIGGSGCKRKLNLTQKGLKSPPAKRKNFDCSCLSESDGSQSPIYSELGFEEVIRMVDENQSLDDDDLLEILTCPSPVWWEDPPDDEYMDGPITVDSPGSSPLPTIAKQKSKSSRKKTPHKLILEPEISTDNNNHDETHTDHIIDDTTFKNINKTDTRFRSKRSKLESLLSTLKNKKDKPKSEKDEHSKENHKEKIDLSETTATKNKSIPNRSKKESETELDDITFANISQQDKDSLKHLENIEIPMEGKSKNLFQETDTKPSVYLRKQSINTGNTLKLIKKSKNISSFVTNKKWKIINIKKMVTDPSMQKRSPIVKILSAKSILKDQRHSEKAQILNTKINEDNDEGDSNVQKKSNQNPNVNKMDDTKTLKENSINEDYVTIIKIVSDINENKEMQAKSQPDVKEKITEESKTENDFTDKVSNSLDLYYKKCKGRKRDLKLNLKDDSEVTDLKKGKEEQSTNEVEVKELCDSCDKNTKKSIIVSSTTDVKYCLKCSCIFDKEECDYCVRKEGEKKRTPEQYEEDESDEIASGFHSLIENNFVDI